MCDTELLSTIHRAQNECDGGASTGTNCKKLKYEIALKRGGNRILTPLEIPDYKELPKVQTDPGPGIYPKEGFPDPKQLQNAATKNKETIDFLVKNNGFESADSLKIEVFDGAKLLYSDTSLTPPPKDGNATWQWDGYDSSGVLDTKVLKSKNLKILLTATKGSDQQTGKPLELSNEAEEEEWVDVKVDRNAKTVDVTVRPKFSDGGVEGNSVKNYTPMTFGQLIDMAKQGIEMYWTRDGSRANGTNPPVQTTKGVYAVRVHADVNVEPTADNFKLKTLLKAPDDDSIVRLDSSTSFWIFSKMVYKIGYWVYKKRSPYRADPDFKHTAAHEFGHRILGAYGDDRTYSWAHKSTSGKIDQQSNPGTSHPASGEIDLMKYSEAALPYTFEDYWDRSIAAEEDVKSLLWLARVKFDD
jgi:hypothetical protein